MMSWCDLGREKASGMSENGSSTWKLSFVSKVNWIINLPLWFQIGFQIAVDIKKAKMETELRGAIEKLGIRSSFKLHQFIRNSINHRLDIFLLKHHRRTPPTIVIYRSHETLFTYSKQLFSSTCTYLIILLQFDSAEWKDQNRKWLIAFAIWMINGFW